MTFGYEARCWLETNIGAKFDELQIRQVDGATSSNIFFIQRRNLNAQQFVLRVPTNKDWVAEEPDLVEHEAAAMAQALAAGLPVPRPIALGDESAGFGVPVLLMSHLKGNVELHPADFSAWLCKLAGQLATLHRHKAEGLAWHYRSWVDESNLIIPEWANNSRLWQQAFDCWHAPAPAYSPVFIHRDYHPVNVLWHEGQISGIVDWPNGCRGPAGVDVGHCRINLAQMYDADAADEFLKFYCLASPGFEYHPYWDLDTILDWCVPMPEFYEPWHQFGLDTIPVEELQKRINVYLERVIHRL